MQKKGRGNFFFSNLQEVNRTGNDVIIKEDLTTKLAMRTKEWCKNTRRTGKKGQRLEFCLENELRRQYT